jgi:hypothetical protein
VPGQGIVTPYFRYALAVLVAVVLAVTAARAEPRPQAEAPEVNMTCVVQMAADVQTLVNMHTHGVPYELVRHLIRSDESNRDAGRWLLTAIHEALEAGLPAVLAHTYLWHLCAIPEPGDVAAKPNANPFPIRPEHKDI